MSKQISFTFNGVAVQCEEGQSIAAALIHAGTRELRTTRFGDEPRSIFCGIGICFDCVVVVDGVANQRSCLITAKANMKIESGS
ncbi:2Fe-2S iron-sulfur cluster binding domain containing protein [Candidatus Nanopelagicaceae bacterium]